MMVLQRNWRNITGRKKRQEHSCYLTFCMIQEEARSVQGLSPFSMKRLFIR
ncbi:hypothetical protein SB48_HM08orf04595 [Heyndrickxia coagulans]|uniref:Uncharacterized protein n=1 Tax=Heyndrickxia coagulans TaxID=1398 RepID=A0AAN0WCF8_HEYCO|nr:hypothetical protein SB48_HM08orf04595 [Heyndrickxia coagulans]